MVKYFAAPFSYHQVPSRGIKSLQLEGCASAYIVLGSHSNVEERLSWQIELAQFVKEKIQAGTPTLGICFGHQLLADAFGCTISKITREPKYFEGTRTVTVTQDMFGIKAQENLQLVMGHGYEISKLSPDFQTFASSPLCLHEGIVHNDFPYWSVQCHPEASPSFIENEIKEAIPENIKEETYRDGLRVISGFLKEAEKY